MKTSCSVLAVLAAAGLCAAAPKDGPGTYYVPPAGTANVTSSAAKPTNAVARRTIAFLGGSITEMNGFRPRVMAQLRAKYPQIDFVEIASGLSSTCSDVAAFRFKEDVLAHGTPDLLIVDAAVNDDQDGHFTRAHSIRGMEGVVRQALKANPAMKVVVALFVNRGQFDMLSKGLVPLPYGPTARWPCATGPLSPMSGPRSRPPRRRARSRGRSTATATRRRKAATSPRTWS